MSHGRNVYKDLDKIPTGHARGQLTKASASMPYVSPMVDVDGQRCLGGLIKTGPTGTNVNDFSVALMSLYEAFGLLY